jgi:hypothetical protein
MPKKLVLFLEIIRKRQCLRKNGNTKLASDDLAM